MSSDGQGNRAAQANDPRLGARNLLRRLTALGVSEVDATQLILTSPNRRLARAIDTFEVLGDDLATDTRTWIATAVEDPEALEAVVERRRGWEAWHRLHRSWDAAETAREEQERRSRAWGAAVSAALDEDQLVRAAQQVTRPVGVLGRRSLPVARAQILAWAVAVHAARPGQPLHQALAADLDGPATAPDPLDEGLPEPPVTDGTRDGDLMERLAAAIGQLADLEPEEPPEPTRRSTRQSQRTLGRTLERGL